MNKSTPKFLFSGPFRRQISSFLKNAVFSSKTHFRELDQANRRQPGQADVELPILFLTGLRNTINRGVQLYCPTRVFQSWSILRIGFLIIGLFFVAGCQSATIVKLRSSTDPNQVIELRGKAADDYAAKIIQVEAANKLTPAGRQNEIYSKLKDLVPFLFATILIAGVAAWWTQSKYVIAIAIAAALGLGLVFVIGAWLTWIKWGMLGIAIVVVLWRSGIYQRERDKLLGAVNGSSKQSLN